MVAKLLDTLHAKFPGCETLAFADLSTQMILIANTDTTHQREGLDALCAEAALAFGPPDAPAIGTNPSHTIIIASPDHLRIYLRSAVEPADALCCVCNHTVAVDDFLQEARACLDQISHGA